MPKSLNWEMWKSEIDMRSCLTCKERNGKIYSINSGKRDDPETLRPPVHPNCRCMMKRLEAIQAGMATKNYLNGADWFLKKYGRLPRYYITRDEAEKLGWKRKKGNLDKVAPGFMLTRGIYSNSDGKLPMIHGRIWYEADINYTGGWRNKERILFSNDGLIFVTYYHYATFAEIV